jgi:hypothetical protein
MSRKSEEIKKQIINEITSISGAYSAYKVFSDWIKCCSLAICNNVHMIHNEDWKRREQDYIDTIGMYPEDVEYRFAKMMCLLAEALEEDMSDILGEIFMEAGLGSKHTGQFFTPFHISEMTAKMALGNTMENYDGDTICLDEPSVGGGGMVIAAAKVLKEAGINYQKKLDVVAQDLDWSGVYMTYLQCSLLGIKATVVQGDTLVEPFDLKTTEPRRIMRTPAKMGVLLI